MLTVRVRRKLLSLVAGRTDGGPNGLNLFFFSMLFRRFRGVMEHNKKNSRGFVLFSPFLSFPCIPVPESAPVRGPKPNQVRVAGNEVKPKFPNGAWAFTQGRGSCRRCSCALYITYNIKICLSDWPLVAAMLLLRGRRMDGVHIQSNPCKISHG